MQLDEPFREELNNPRAYTSLKIAYFLEFSESSFHALWSVWSSITNPNPDLLKGTHPKSHFDVNQGKKRGVPVVSWSVKGKIQESSTLPTVYSKQPHTGFIMHLSAAIPGVDPGEPQGHLHQDICKFHLPRANIIPQKATTVLPSGSIIWKDSHIVT